MVRSIPKTMSAIRKLHDSPGLDWRTDVPVPEIGPRDVLIAVTHAGICGTDRHIYEWDAWSQSRVQLGITTGHEFVGRVAAIGSAVTRTVVGQRVSAEGHIGCGIVRALPYGQRAHLRESRHHRHRPRRLLRPVCRRAGRKHLARPCRHPGQDRGGVRSAWQRGSYRHVRRRQRAQRVDHRRGDIGLMAVTVARAAGASRILVTDVDPRRLKIARDLGADETFLATRQRLGREGPPGDAESRTARAVGNERQRDRRFATASPPCATAARRLCWVCLRGRWNWICPTISFSKGRRC